MTKQIREYLMFMREFMSSGHTNDELIAQRSLLLKRIQFYQHERLIHLLVTLAFALFFLLSLFMALILKQLGILVLTGLFLVLLVPYIKHYYFLENSVQELYTIYYKLEKL
ncbi:MAG: hypothetical protein E7485_06595 [Ruminococcaceae bacterium]|nr:hypothetical protein [Oscillospiraceae bacterium]